MTLKRIEIENFKSIKKADIDLSEMNLFIGGNGSGKSNVLDAVCYFYNNLTGAKISDNIFDKNNHFSNEATITLTFDLSEFYKIAKANMPHVDEDKRSYVGYYSAILTLVSGTPSKHISLRMSQIKGKAIKWNFSYENRQLINSLFPLFHIDSRTLDVTKWQSVWDILGELAKVSNKEKKNLEAGIKSLLLDSKNTISNKLNSIETIFENSDVNISKATPQNFAEKLTQVFFSGDEIFQKGRNLEYYSTGTNSVKYIEVLLMAIDELSKKKLKSPIILMDEPEISLHHQFIDELSTTLAHMSSRHNTLIATHSSRLTKNIILGFDDFMLYNIKLINKYSIITRMKKFIQYSPKSKYRVTDDHINSYFSKAVIFVEGETELELFSNPYLKELFPALNKVDVFKAISDKPVLSIMNPSSVGVNTPYIILIDMDKAVNFDTKRNQLRVESEYISGDLKERFQYRSKKDNAVYLYHLYKRITAAANSLKIRYYTPFYSTKDDNYYDFLRAVKSYLISYNVFPFRTTVEGAFINKMSFDFTLQFLKERCSSADYNLLKDALDTYYFNDQINFLRYIFKGKSDLLQYKSINNFTFEGKDVAQRIQGAVGKASGWISDYIDMFISEKTGLGNKLSFKSFRTYLEIKDNKNKIENEFKYSFPEMYSLITYIYGIIS